jgi:ADP-heptose:LPS heptosyltransferase
MPEAVGRLLVVAPNWLGDSVMALPAIQTLRDAWPGAHLAVAARPSVAALLAMVPGVQ